MIENMTTKNLIVVQNNVNEWKEVTDDKEVKVKKEVVKELGLNHMEQEELVVKVKQDKEEVVAPLGLRFRKLKVEEVKRVLEMEVDYTVVEKDLFYVVLNQGKV